MNEDKEVNYLEEGYVRWQYDQDTQEPEPQSINPLNVTAAISLGIGVIGGLASLFGIKKAIQVIARENSE
jgi:hypothetical protein